MIAKTSPMGWNSWDCYGAAVNEETVRKNADYAAKNLLKYGYEYIVVDIQWSEPTAKNHEYHPFTELCMDEYSRLIPAENRFPSSAGGKGFALLAEYIHSLGLKFGIHIMRGIPRQAVHRNTKIMGTDKRARDIADTNSICAWNTDMYGVDASKEGAKEYYDSIFELYASWGVDFVKVDDICRELPHRENELIMLSQALHSCKRDMVLSLSPGPALLEKAEVYKQVSNMWRITDDFWDNWESLYAMFERAEKWCVHAGAGHFPDADMLPVGAILQDYNTDNRTKFSKDEQYTMMSLWCIMRSPLMIGAELTLCDKFTLDLLTNEKILEMHSKSRAAHMLYRREENGAERIVWTAFCDGGGQYIAVFNTSDKNVEITVNLEEAEIHTPVSSVTELWSGENISCSDKISSEINSHGAKVFLVK